VLRGLNVLNPEAAEGALQHEKSLTDLDIDDIEAASLTLARKHSVLTWIRCKFYFWQSNGPLDEIPTPVQEIMGSLSSEAGSIEAEMVGKD
jgi:small-conductance mechanosensitive channel